MRIVRKRANVMGQWHVEDIRWCLLAIALLLSVELGQAQVVPPREVAPGVWFLEGDARAGDCNSVLIEMEHYLVLVDPSYPARTRQLMALIPQISKKPVRYVVDTHAHRDHAYGNVLWTRAGAVTLASEGVRNEMRGYEPERWQTTSALRPDVRDLGLATAQPPQRVFRGRRLRLCDGRREVDLLYLGWGHTRGDTWVWLPHERVLCTGDAAVNGPRNKLWDANVGNWPKVIDRAAALKPAVVLPGHGAAGGPEILAGQAAFLRYLYREVQAQMAAGWDVATVSSAFKLPAADANWVPLNLIQDIEITAREIAEGRPAGALQHTWK